MKNLLSLFLLLVNAGVSIAAEVVVLENESLRAAWDAGRGTLVSLKDKATGREWLDTAVQTPGYTVQLAGEKSPLTSGNATSVRARKEGAAVVVEAEHPGRTVICDFRLETGGSGVLGRIALRSVEPCRIAKVCFPLVTLRLPFSGTGEDDRLLWPECDGSLLSNPLQNKPDRRFPYPGNASLQLMAAYDGTAGLFFSARDATGHAKAFCSRRSGSGLELSIAHVLPQTPVLEWKLPYDVVVAGLKPLPGMPGITWESAAEQYRPWAVQQPWSRRTMAQRVAEGDIPAWVAKPNLVLTYALRGDLPDKSQGNRQPLLTDMVRRWSRVVETPVTCLIASWEKRGTWVTPDYFPPYGGEREFAAMNQTLQAEGHRSMVFLSGLYWTLRKKIGDEVLDQQAEFDRAGRKSAISDAQGEPLLRGPAESDIGLAATICPSTALARELLAGTSQRCQELGIGCVQVDQIVGGGLRECFHPGHTHPPGGGTWSAEALYRIFSEIRQAGRARDPKFVFSLEEPGEFYLPVLDTYHARDLHQGRWPRSGACVTGVPLFTHVYHEYLAGYGSEGCYASEHPSQLALFQMGSNLVCGKAPAVALWGRWVEPEKVNKVQLRLLRSHLALWRGEAGEFLNYGRRVASPALAVPALDMVFVEKDGAKRPQKVPAVLHARWQLANGRTATVFACIADKPVDFVVGKERIRLEPGETAFRPSE